jgi:hypothetical protein
MVAQLRERAKADGEDHCYGDSLLLDRIARRDPRPKVQEVVRAYEARIGRSLVKEGDGDARSDLAKIVAQLLALY